MAIHVVQTGDSLRKISAKFEIPIQTIIELNGLQSANAIIPGLALYLPDNKPPLLSYRIKEGDYIWKLAQQFNTDTSAITAVNPGITPNKLSIGQIINIPRPMKLRISTLGFLLPSSEKENLDRLNSLANQLTYIAVVAYSFTSEGWAYNEISDTAIITRSKQLNITPLLMIRNFTGNDFSAELAGKVLGNPTYRRNLVSSLANLTSQRGFRGVSIDIEFIPPSQRNDFILFLTELKRELGELILHVNVHAKTKDIPKNPIIGAYDYASIGKVADLVGVMTIDYGYPDGPPDPIAPITWMEEVIKYSTTQINSRKLQIAMPLYGYDKIIPTNTTRALSVLAAQNQAISTGTSIQYNTTEQSPWYRYWRGSEEHIVWFEDIRSYVEKYKLIDIYKLNGTTYWHIGLSAPQNWTYLKTRRRSQVN